MPELMPFPRARVRIHPTAIVDRHASLGVDVEIGPFAIVEAGGRIGDRTRVMASAFIAAGADIGADCEVHLGAVLGHAAQIRDLRGPGGGLIVGPRTIVREYATIHCASREGINTVIGSDARGKANTILFMTLVMKIYYAHHV